MTSIDRSPKFILVAGSAYDLTECEIWLSNELGKALAREAYGLVIDSTSVSSLRRARILWNSLRHLGRLMDVARALFQIAPVSCD